MTERVDAFLTTAQLRKFQKGDSFQLTPNQLGHLDKQTGKKHHVEILLSKPNYAKLLRNVRQNKGFRFTRDIIQGGSFLGDVWNGVKKAGNFVKEYVSPEMVKTGLTAAATAAGTMVGNPELGLMASPLISKAVDYGYSKIRKPIREEIRDRVEEYRPRLEKKFDEFAPGVRKMYSKVKRRYYDEDDDDDDDEYEYVPPPPPRRRRQKAAPPHSDYRGYMGGNILDDAVGSVRGFIGVGLKKGSPEAKAKMAKLRAMRGKSKGGSFRSPGEGGNILHDAVGEVRGFLGVGLKKGSPEMKAKMAKLRAMRGKSIKGGWNPFNGDDWRDLGDKIADPIRGGIDKISDPIRGGIDKISDPIRGAIDQTADFFNTAVSTASPIVNAAMNEVKEQFKPGGTAEQLGKQIASALIHQGIPKALSYTCGALAEVVFPESGPLAGALGSQAGERLGNMIADKLGEQTGYGIRKGRRKNNVHVKYGTLVDGVPYPHKRGGGRIMTEELR